MDKLQELTDKLYNEGLSKGQAEGEKILADAKARAAEIVDGAKAEAARILSEAEAKAADLRSKTESDIRMASSQALQATKKDIEDLLVSAVSADKVGTSLSDPDFLKEIIRTVAGQFSASESKDIALMMPAALQDKLEPWVSTELAKAVGGGIKAGFSKKITGGFNIGPKDGSWFVSLTDETFKDLIAEYMRPVTKKILFGE